MEPIILPRISDQKPLVSVITTAYNHEPYIRDCLEGFLLQKTSFPVEFIIHDDASTDHTADIIREYYKKRPDVFHVIIQKDNQFSKHKKITLSLCEKAQGKYIALCEGDDYWTDPFKLQKQVDFLEKNEEYIAVVHKYDVINKFGIRQDQKTFGYYEEKKAGRYTLKDLDKDLGLPSQLGSLMFRNFFLAGTFVYPEELKRINLPGDQKLCFLLLLHGDFYRMKDTMSVYRYVVEPGGGSWSSKMIKGFNPYQRWEEYLKIEELAKSYGKIMKFKRRRIHFGEIMIIKALKRRDHTSIKHFFHYMKVQEGSFLYIPYTILRLSINTILVIVLKKQPI